MEKKIVTRIKMLCLLGVSLSLCGCASLKGPLKAPCGPTAGLTDPCGDRIDINNIESIGETAVIYKAII